MIQFPIDFENDTARAVRVLRAWLGDDQGPFATRFGVGRHAVICWESGRSTPKKANRMALASIAEQAIKKTPDQQEGPNE